MKDQEHMACEFKGSFISFLETGNADPKREGHVLIELTERDKGGFIELAFTVGRERMYLKFQMHELERAVKVMKRLPPRPQGSES